VILPARAPGHEAVAEIDEAAQRHEWEEYGLLEAHAVGSTRLLLEDASLADVGTEPHVRPVQEHGLAEKAAFELDVAAQLAAFDGDRTFAAYL